MQLFRRRLRIAIRLTLIAVALWLLVSLAAVHWLTNRHFSDAPESPPTGVLESAQQFRLTTVDALEELGVCFAGGDGTKPVVILLHGNGGSRQSMTPIAEFLHAEGFGVVIPNLRCHGDSTGSRNDLGYTARLDVLTVQQWVQNNCGDRRYFVLGQSMGAAAAIFAAAEVKMPAAGYIFESPYERLTTAVRNRTRMVLPAIIEPIGYYGLRITAPLLIGEVERIAPVEAARALAGMPVLILAGGADRNATVAESEAIARAVGRSARVEVFEDAGHYQLLERDPERYRRLVLEFLRR